MAPPCTCNIGKNARDLLCGNDWNTDNTVTVATSNNNVAFKAAFKQANAAASGSLTVTYKHTSGAKVDATVETSGKRKLVVSTNKLGVKGLTGSVTLNACSPACGDNCGGVGLSDAAVNLAYVNDNVNTEATVRFFDCKNKLAAPQVTLCASTARKGFTVGASVTVVQPAAAAPAADGAAAASTSVASALQNQKVALSYTGSNYEVAVKGCNDKGKHTVTTSFIQNVGADLDVAASVVYNVGAEKNPAVLTLAASSRRDGAVLKGKIGTDMKAGLAFKAPLGSRSTLSLVSAVPLNGGAASFGVQVALN